MRFCGTTNEMIMEARRRRGGRNQTSKWMKSHLKVAILDRLPNVKQAIFEAVVIQGVAAWSRHCGLTAELVSDSASADVVILAQKIDRSGGTLAMAELPPGDDRQLRMWFDLADRWWAVDGLAPPSSNAIDLLAVFCHEWGHIMGIGHEQTESVIALMDPHYNVQVREPQDWDIMQGVARYGIGEEPEPEEPDNREGPTGPDGCDCEPGDPGDDKQCSLPEMIYLEIEIDGVQYRTPLDKVKVKEALFVRNNELPEWARSHMRGYDL